MAEVLCLGPKCPLHREVVDVDDDDGTHVYESWCLANLDNPIFLYSVNVKADSNVAFQSTIVCEYPPVWINPKR